MPRTLADMTVEEQFECVGMWADDAESPYLAVISAVYAGGYAGCFYPEIDGRYESFSSEITPRFDLPRAFGPDGKPVKGEWNYLKKQGGVTYPDSINPTHRCFRTDYEPIPEELP